MPKKHVPRMTPIHTSVCAAFFDSGFLNAGTPLDTASTPDSATAPEENARSSMSSVTALGALRQLSGLDADLRRVDRAEVLDEDAEQADGDQQRAARRCRRTSAAANSAPDSFRPRRLAERHQDDAHEADRRRVHLLSKPNAERMAGDAAGHATRRR